MIQGLVSIVIPNWNGMRFIKECLDSLLHQSYKHLEIIFVDNGSSDDSVKYVKAHYPSVTIIALDHNHGFSEGVNQGIRHVRGEYIMLLNNDTIVDDRCIEELYKAMENYPSVGFLASKMLFAGSERIINATGDCMCVDGIARNIGFREIDNGQYEMQVEVFGACAGAAFYRRKVFEEVGLFDEDFFLIFEDVDWNFRAQLAGYKCLFVPNAIVYHLHSGTMGTVSSTTTYYTAKNDMNVLIKNMPLSLFLKYLVNIFMRQQKYAILSVSIDQLLPFLKGEIKAFLQLPSMLLKRYKLLQSRKVSVDYIDSILNERGINF